MASAIAQPAAAPDRPDSPRPLKWLVWAFCLVLVALVWWFVGAQVAFERGQAIEDAIRQNVNRTIAFEQYVRRTLEAADLVTRYVGGRFARGDPGPEFAGTPDRPARISGNVARNGTFLSVNVFDPRGDLVATSVQRELPRLNAGQHPAFRAHVARDTGRLYVGQPVYGPVFGRNVIWLSRRLNRPDGSFAGVIAINTVPEQFTSFYRDASVGPKDVMSVIGLDGITRARRVGQVSSSGEDYRGHAFLQRQLRHPSGTYLGTGAADGIARYFSQRRLHDYPLFVAYGVPESEVLAPSRRRARILIASAALASLFIVAFAALLTFYLSRRDRLVAEMARANQRLQEAQRIGQIGDWDYDLRTGAVYWSPQLCAQFEREPAQGSPTFDEFQSYLDDDGRATIDRAHAEAIRTGESQEVEYDVRLPSGAESRHQGVVIPTFDGAGNVVRLHGTDQNISARNLLDRLQSQVAHLSRVEAMNAMAATLAHELNQPLTAASNYLAGTRRRLSSNEAGALAEIEHGMVAAEQQVHLAANIIRRVREMVVKQPRSDGVVSLSRLVDNVTTLLSVATAYPGLTVRKEIAADARTVRGDKIQIQQVMLNLIRNACDATVGREAPAIIVSSTRQGDGTVQVAVSDNGPGFSQPDGARFSPFASTKEGGLGLGLSISRTIVESHGGRIWTEDRAGEGARICFTLQAPRRPAEAGSADAAAA
ncbi:MAG TPA: ATP-binding protein [Allosphingosinicella sp.]|nr:ATP-binding protein [Allosphingosinicella sp.]